MNPIDQIFKAVVEPYLAPRVKRGSIQAVKAYISSIKALREAAISAFTIGATAGVLVTGLVLIIVGMIGLLPISAEAMLITMIAIGVVMVGAATFLARAGAKEERWLKLSKSAELIEAVTGEWENSLIPPDPRKVMREASQKKEAADSCEENRKLAAAARELREPLSEMAADVPRPV